MRLERQFGFRLVLPAALAIALLAAPMTALGQEGPLDPSQPKGITTEEIIRRFATKEKEFKEARDRYTYRQDSKMEEMDGNTPTGEWHQVVDILFDNRGRRIESVVFAPQPSLQRIMMTKEDVDDLQNRLPFVLTSDEIPDYQILYAGQQKEDELNTYVFDIAPKSIQKNRRYFQGRIWVDDHDLQIVKTKGKSVPEIRSKNGENLFPEFTTWREQIDGKYWFPTYTRVDDTLRFSTGEVKVRQVVKYLNYKRFGADVKITYGGSEVEKVPEGESKQPQAGPQGTSSPQKPAK